MVIVRLLLMVLPEMEEESTEVYCYCRGGQAGQMVGCDNENVRSVTLLDRACCVCVRLAGRGEVWCHPTCWPFCSSHTLCVSVLFHPLGCSVASNGFISIALG